MARGKKSNIWLYIAVGAGAYLLLRPGDDKAPRTRRDGRKQREVAVSRAELTRQRSAM